MSSDGGRLLMDLVAGNIIHGEYGVVANALARRYSAVHFYQEKRSIFQIVRFQDFLAVVEKKT
jgi:hypothetical protein